MAEHTRGQDPKHRSNDSSGRTVKDVRQKTSGDDKANTSLDEKSSGAGRREKNTGLATKDGLTGSDYDGQVTD